MRFEKWGLREREGQWGGEFDAWQAGQGRWKALVGGEGGEGERGVWEDLGEVERVILRKKTNTKEGLSLYGYDVMI